MEGSLSRLEKLRLVTLPRRLEILCVLQASVTPLRVSEITAACSNSIQPEVSQQLRLFRDAGIVAAERKGTSVYYAIADQEMIEVLLALQRCWQSTQGFPVSINPK